MTVELSDDEASKDVQAPPDNALTLIHLSDIHLLGLPVDAEADLDRYLRDALVEDLGALVQKLNHVDALIISGDVAFSGQLVEYDKSRNWLDQLATAAQLGQHRIWMVPGNHDVNLREVDRRAYALHSIRQRFSTLGLDRIDDELNRLLGDEHSAEVFLAPLADYNNFAATYSCQITRDRLAWQQPLRLNDGTRLLLRGLTSALFSRAGEDDTGEHRMTLGERQYQFSRDPCDVTIAVCHHPPNWIRDAEKFERHLEHYAAVQMFGHEHEYSTRRVGNCLRLAAGALHPERGGKWQPRYNIIQLWVESNNQRWLIVRVWPRKWDPASLRFAEDPKDGPDFMTERLPLPACEAASPREPEAVEVVSSSQAVAIPEPQLDPYRRMAFRFLTLPVADRIGIIELIGLGEPSDTQLADHQLFVRAFQRAQQRGTLGRLWEAIERQHGTEDLRNNPF